MPTLNFWGVQGSCPGAYFDDNLGSNTSCVSIEIDDTLIILDAGTGIRSLSASVDMNQYNQVVLLITHSHWDHIQGFPFFTYIYQQKPLIIYSHLNEHINGLMEQINGINFPLNRHEIPCDIQVKTDLDELNALINVNVSTIKTNHQGNCIGYRIKADNCDVCYIPDNQLHNTSITSFDEFVSFCKGTNVLIHDSQYTATDMPYKIDWGHSIYTDALDLSLKTGAKQLALFHHEPTRPKDDILKLVDNCKSITNDINVFAATERTKIDLLGN